MQPHRVVSWKSGITLLFREAVTIIEEYEETVSSPSITMKVPSIIQLNNARFNKNRNIGFTRPNVYLRDEMKCQYCGTRKVSSELNFDHVIPRVKGGKTNWTNIVTSCYDCNKYKGELTPEQAGMRLLREPFKPTYLPLNFLVLNYNNIPKSWLDYCTQSAMDSTPDSIKVHRY